MKNAESPALRTCSVALRLLLVCLGVAALVALVFTVTEGPIAAGESARKEEAVRRIFPTLAAFEELDGSFGEGVNTVYTVTDAAGGLLGYCVDYTGQSDYGGEVGMMIGVDGAHHVLGLQIIRHSETFIDRYLDGDGLYTGLDAERGADISAGATLSYNAIRDAMEAVSAMEFGGETA